MKYQSLDGLATGIDSTYVTIDAEALDDYRGVDIIGITSCNAMIASNYIRDSEPPMLTTFSLDMNENRLWLTFDEPMQDIINFALFSLQADSVNIMNTAIDFSSGVYLDYHYNNTFYSQSTILQFRLSNTLGNLLYTDPLIAKNANSTNLVVMQGGVFDASGNPINITGPVSVNGLISRPCKFHN